MIKTVCEKRMFDLTDIVTGHSRQYHLASWQKILASFSNIDDLLPSMRRIIPGNFNSIAITTQILWQYIALRLYVAFS